jgi:transcriptional regulator with XRE-family HTH domain
MSNVQPITQPLDNRANEIVAANIRGELGYRNLTQGRLAHHLGLSEMSLSRRMKSQADFTTTEIVAIAAFFKMAPGDLFTEKDVQITDWSLASVTPIRPNKPAVTFPTSAKVTPIRSAR